MFKLKNIQQNTVYLFIFAIVDVSLLGYDIYYAGLNVLCIVATFCALLRNKKYMLVRVYVWFPVC